MKDITEFNEKYSKYLAPMFYGLSIHNERIVKFLDEMFQIYMLDYPDFVFYQIKLKFGKARVYIDNIPDEEIRKLEKHIDKILKDYV